MECKVADCKHTYYSKGFCKMHYDKNRRHGDPLFKEKFKKDEPCSILGCDKLKFANDLCSLHNRRLQRHGDPLYVNPKCNRDGGYKVRHKGYLRNWKKENPENVKTSNTKRKSKIKPIQLNALDTQRLINMYKNCPVGYQVDHILPLTHKNISGLHVPWNMQYLTKPENLRKSNKFDRTYENESWRNTLKTKKDEAM